MESIHELLGYKHIKIIQNEDMFCFSLDSMLLAHFIKIGAKTKRIIDLGCGNAPIPLYLTLKTKAKIIGIEIQQDVADMAQRSVALNQLEHQIEIINADFKDIYKRDFANKFDIVISNPPYFKVEDHNRFNKNDYLTIARHEVKATLADVLNEAKKLLIDGGTFYMVHRANRLEDIVYVMKTSNFQIKTMQFVYPKASDLEALLVLIEARKNRKSGLKVIQPLYVYTEDNEYTNDVKKIFNFKSSDHQSMI